MKNKKPFAGEIGELGYSFERKDGRKMRVVKSAPSGHIYVETQTPRRKNEIQDVKSLLLRRDTAAMLACMIMELLERDTVEELIECADIKTLKSKSK